MSDGLSRDYGFIGSGDLMIKNLNDSSDQWRPIGNATVFSLQPLYDKYERTSRKRDTAGQTLETVIRAKGVDVKITVDTFGRQNLALALAGSDAALTQTAQTDATATLALPHDRWVFVGHYNISGVEVSDGVASSLVENTDFLVKAEAGLVMALSTGAIADGASCTVTYDAAAITAADNAYSILGGASVDVLLGLKLDGKNASTGETILVDVHRLRITPESAVGFITSEFNTLELVGRAETPEDQDSPFTVRTLPALA